MPLGCHYDRCPLFCPLCDIDIEAVGAGATLSTNLAKRLFISVTATARDAMLWPFADRQDLLDPPDGCMVVHFLTVAGGGEGGCK
jgi:hypothetical protein